MSYPQTQTHSNSHLYPEALQLKLYQAFIFAIPILFSVILFLLFYLFYLKRRFSHASPAAILPRSTLNIQPTTFPPMDDQVTLKANLKDKLSIVVFDDDLKARDSQCCVCLGEFELKEEVQQIPLCKHIFHTYCIFHWLHSNATCPLCRCAVIHVPKHPCSDPVTVLGPNAQDDMNLEVVSPYQEQVTIIDINLTNSCTVEEEHVVIHVQGSSSSSTSL